VSNIEQINLGYLEKYYQKLVSGAPSSHSSSFPDRRKDLQHMLQAKGEVQIHP